MKTAILIDEVTDVLRRTNVSVDNMTVPLHKKVHVTIWMLANHAISYRATSDLFGLSKGTAHLIFISTLKDVYIKWPNVESQLTHAMKIQQRTNFPGVIGSIDGCHIPIKAPSNNAYDFFNRKQFYSVVLQGVCDSDLNFMNIYIGMTGKAHDARIFRVSPLSNEIEHGLIEKHLHLLGDSAYPLSVNLLTPYRDTDHLTDHHTRYNRKHVAIRSSIERAFGLLKNKFRRLQYLDMTLTNEIPIVISACCVLHNFVLHHDGLQIEEYDVYEEYVGREEAPHHVQRNREAEIKRSHITQNL